MADCAPHQRNGTSPPPGVTTGWSRKAFLKAGILTEDARLQDSTAGTPQGVILSPLLANVALSVLDEHIAGLPGGPVTGPLERAKRLRHGQPNFRLVRYADDWCV